MEGIKEQLVFVPHYMGSLRYFEKLIPHLSGKYKVCFLLVDAKRDHEYFEEMKKYCASAGYCFTTIEIPINFFKKLSASRVGWFFKTWICQKFLESWSQFKAVKFFKKSADNFLKDSSIKKIVSVNDNSIYMRYFLGQANRKGIDTMILQWALSYEGQRLRPKKNRGFLERNIYYFTKFILSFFNKTARRIIFGGDFEHKKGVAGAGPAKRLGVINEQAKNYLLENGVSGGKISIVGYLDFYLAEKMKKELDNNLGQKIRIAEKMGVNLSKKNITIFSCPLYLKDVTVLTKEGQLEYTEKMFKTIRENCLESLFQINFKAHPSEDLLIYEPLAKKYGVRLFDKNTNNFELIYLSDLYISENSTTNFIPIIMGKDSIFENFIDLPVVEKAREYFGIKRYIHEITEFEALIKGWAGGKLEKQYAYDEKIFTKDSLQKIVNWVG